MPHFGLFKRLYIERHNLFSGDIKDQNAVKCCWQPEQKTYASSYLSAGLASRVEGKGGRVSYKLKA